MAEGICDVINAKMAQAIRTLTVEKGIEPRDFALVAFGGAGPMHAPFLAQELDVGEVLVPRFPGAFSAWGMLEAEIRQDFARAYYTPLADLDAQDLTKTLEEQEHEALARARRGRSPNRQRPRRASARRPLHRPGIHAHDPAHPRERAGHRRLQHSNQRPLRRGSRHAVRAREPGRPDRVRNRTLNRSRRPEPGRTRAPGHNHERRHTTSHPRDRVRPHRARRPSPATRRPASGLNHKTARP